MERKLKYIFSGVAASGLALMMFMPTMAAATTSVITPSDASWWFVQETPTGSGTFTYGPSAPPLGGGSARLTVNGAGAEILGTFAYAGTRLDAITSLGYSTYRTSGSGALAPSLQFDIDTNVTDANTAWQGRLVYEPYYTHAVTTGVWQTWNPLDNAGTGNWWFSGAPGNAACPINNACTWSEVRAAFPNAGIRSAGPNTGAVQFKAGSGWASGFTGSVDAFTIAANSVATTYDFELPYTIPTLTANSPVSKLTTDPGFTLTVNGTDFFPASVVRWNGSDRATTYASSTQLTAAIPASDLSAAGTFPITIVNPGPGGGVSNALSFTVLAPPGTPSAASNVVRTATIYVVNIVINDNGGTRSFSDFPLFINDIPVASGVGNVFPAPADAYMVTESDDIGYKRSFSGDCDVNGRLSVMPQDVKFCIITTEDIGLPSVMPPVPPLIDIVKVPSPLALPDGPGPVSYTYTLRNIGAVPVTDITMIGDSCGPIALVNGDIDQDSRLGVNETWVYTCATTLTETHTNTVVATGWANGFVASDIATATVVVGAPRLPDTGIIIPPLIHLTKIPSPFTLVAGGGPVTYTEKITNPGEVALDNVRLSDDKCSPMLYGSGDTDGDARLDKDETWTYTCRTNLIKTTVNTAVASGEASGLTVRDFAVAIVVVADVVPGLPDTGSAPYRADEERASAPSIDSDKGLQAPSPIATVPCADGTLMKLANDGNSATQVDSALYACGADGNRYVFPDLGTYSSWYKDFSGVQIIGPEALAAIPLGGAVTYRPGSRLLKIESDPKVYAVAKGGVLRWVTDEALARSLYGAGWNKMISDLPVANLSDSYVIGDPITSADAIPSTAAACTTATTFTAQLSVGSTDSQVLPLQTLLQCLGYFPADVIPTGYFGPVTQRAVKDFQSAKGIASIGYLEASTREALNQYVAR